MDKLTGLRRYPVIEKKNTIKSNDLIDRLEEYYGQHLTILRTTIPLDVTLTMVLHEVRNEHKED